MHRDQFANSLATFPSSNDVHEAQIHAFQPNRGSILD